MIVFPSNSLIQRLSLRILASVVLTLPTAETVLAQNIHIQTPYPLGSQYNALKDQFSQRCVNVISTSPSDGRISNLGFSIPSAKTNGSTGGYYQIYKHDLITNSSDLSSLLGLTASARIGFISGSASGSASYTSTHRVSERYTYLVISNTVLTEEFDASFSVPDNLKAIAASNPKAFYDRCGTHYVAAIAKSASFEAVVEIRSRDESESRDLTAAFTVKASGGSMNASLEETYQKAVKGGRISATIVTHGPLITTEPQVNDVDAVINYARTFGDRISSEAEKGKPVWIQTSAILESYGAIAPGADDMGLQALYLGKLAEASDSAKTNLANLELAVSDSTGDGATVQSVSLSDATVSRKGFADYLNYLKGLGLMCAKDPITKCVFPSDFNSHVPQLPRLDFVRWTKLPIVGFTTLTLGPGERALLSIQGEFVGTGQGPYPTSAHMAAGALYHISTGGSAGERYDPFRVYQGPALITLSSTILETRSVDEGDRARIRLVPQ